MAALPDWLTTREVPHLTDVGPRRRNAGFVRRGLGAVLGAVAALVDPREGVAGEGWLAELDARAKIVGLLGLLACATLVGAYAPLLLALSWVLIVAALGGVSWRSLRRPLGVAPLFAFSVSAPATLSVITPGRPVAVLWHLGAGHWGPWQWPETLAVTESGLLVGGRLALRIVACVALGALLTSSTRPRALFGGLRGLGVPSGVVLVFDMTARYLALLLKSAEEIHLAKLSRSILRLGAGRDRAWAAAGVGELYRKSAALAGEVGDAMVSRGFSGEVRALAAGRWGWPETAFVAACAGGGVTLLLMG